MGYKTKLDCCEDDDNWICGNTNKRILATETPIPIAARVTSPIVPVDLVALREPNGDIKKPAPPTERPFLPRWQRRLKMLVQSPSFWMLLVILYLLFRK